MAGPFVSVEDTRVPLSSGNTMIFFHTGLFDTSWIDAISRYNNGIGFDMPGGHDGEGDVYSVEISNGANGELAWAQVAGTVAKLVNTQNQSSTQYNAKTQVLEDGTFVAFWSEVDSSGTSLCYQRFDAGGNIMGSNVAIPTQADITDTASVSSISGNSFRIEIGNSQETFTVSEFSGSGSVGVSEGIEKTVLGSDSDFFIGSANQDLVETGGGIDEIYTGSGADTVVVQGDPNAGVGQTSVYRTIVVSVENNMFVFDNNTMPYMEMEAGQTYRFDMSHSTNIGHAIGFSDNWDGPHDIYGGYSSYPGPLSWTAVGNAGEDGAYADFTVPADYFEYYPDVYYYCEYHPGMGGYAHVMPSYDGAMGMDYDYPQSDVTTVDVGVDSDADTVQVDSTFSGALLIKNADTSDTVEIMRDTGLWSVDRDGNIIIQMGDEDTITIEDYLRYDEQQDIYVTSGPVITASGYEPFDLGFGDLTIASLRGSIFTNDLLYSPSYNAIAEEGVLYSAAGWDGADIIYGGGGTQQLLGGLGVDTFHLSSAAQNTLIIGDTETSGGRTESSQEGGLPSVSSNNTDFGDAVYLDWLKSDITLSEQGLGHFRIEHAGTGSVIDLYDVEALHFSDGEYKALTEGRVIGRNDWTGSAAGMDIDYDQNDVSFQVDGDIVKVMASGYITVTEEQFETIEYAEYIGEAAYGYRHAWYDPSFPSGSAENWDMSWGAGNWQYVTEQISMGVQTYDRYLENEVIWEGSRTEVDAFDFGSTSVNVINVSSEDIAGTSVFDTIATEGIDLVFGTANADFIDGRGGDDIIFGGGGDDVIIGGGGNDVIIGGDGSDILRGDRVDSNDAALAAWQAGIAEFNAENPDNTVTFDENMLSIDNSGTNAGDGNDVIVGGDGLDDIKSGDGQNFVTSGKADIDGDGQANLDLINQNIDNHQHLLEDEDWV